MLYSVSAILRFYWQSWTITVFIRDAISCIYLCISIMFNFCTLLIISDLKQQKTQANCHILFCLIWLRKNLQLSVGLKLALLKLLKIQTKYINPEINTKIVKFLLDLQCISPKYSEHSSVVFIFFNIWSCGFKIQTKLTQNGLTFPTFDVLNISNVWLFKYFQHLAS